MNPYDVYHTHTNIYINTRLYPYKQRSGRFPARPPGSLPPSPHLSLPPDQRLRAQGIPLVAVRAQRFLESSVSFSIRSFFLFLVPPSFLVLCPGSLSVVQFVVPRVHDDVALERRGLERVLRAEGPVTSDALPVA